MLPPARAEETADYFAALVTRACTGDALAFERIMLATEQRVVSIAWRMLGNRDDASDAAQEVYLRVFKYLTRFRAGEDFRAWLYRITMGLQREAVLPERGGSDVRDRHGRKVRVIARE